MKNSICAGFTIICFLFLSVPVNSQYKNVRVSVSAQPFNINHEEVTIAINPVNPDMLAAGANINIFYSSADGGYTWKEKTMSSSLGVWGDPCVIYDREGNLYYGHLSNPRNGYWIDRIVVQKSTDNGNSWNDGAGVGFNPPVRNQDKEWLIADWTDSPYRNNIYMAWTQFDQYGSSSPKDKSRILFSYSADKGIVWSDPVIVSDASGDCLDGDNTVEGAVPAVGPEGQVYLAWSGPSGIMFDKSPDGGNTFGKDIFAADQPGGWDFSVEGIFRCNGMPVTLCDISRSSNRGNVYILWSDQRNGSSNTDIFFARSTDEGETWSPPVRVNDDDTKRHQFFTWGCVDPVTGGIYIVFYDRRDTEGIATDVYVARSRDGGNSFTNFKVSNSSFTPYHGLFFGDYTNISAYNGKIYPIWMRMDDNVISSWIAIIEDTVTVAAGNENEPVRPDFFLGQNYPNPFNPSTTISYSIPNETHPSVPSREGNIRGVSVTLKVYDVLGRQVAILVDEEQKPGRYEVTWNAANPDKSGSGVYFYQLKAGGFTETKKMTLLR